MTNRELTDRAQKVLFQNYRTQPVALVRGEGTQVWDADGKRYLDFIGGIATVSVGHANAQVRNAVLEQTKLLWHASNLYFTEPQVRLAEKLTRLCFADRVFFCNSGTEANEAMIKLARRWHVDCGHPERIEIVCMHESFHGRTLGALAATGQPKYQQGFGPLPAGFRFVDYGDVRQLEAVVNDKTCAVILEPLQGEAGVITAPAGYLKAVRDLCDKHGALRLLDHVRRISEVLQARLAALPRATSRVASERGLGLLRAVVLAEDLAPKVVAKARELGLLVNAIGDRVLRLAPPLTVSESEIQEATAVLTQAIAQA